MCRAYCTFYLFIFPSNSSFTILSIQSEYNKMYIIDPGCSMQVEALADAYGLKVAIVYDASPDRNILMYERWQCKNDSTLTVTQFVGSEISTYGGERRALSFLWILTFLSFLTFLSLLLPAFMSFSFVFPLESKVTNVLFYLY